MTIPKNRNEGSGTTKIRRHQVDDVEKSVARRINLQLGDRTGAWLARETGLPAATISDALARGPVKVEAALKIASALGMSLDEMMLGVASSPAVGTVAENSAVRPVPILDVVASAGSGATNDYPKTVGEMYFSERDLRRFGRYDQLRIIRAKGDSMHPEIRDDDLVMFDLSNADFRDGIMIINRDGLLVIKRLEMIGGSKVRLLSDNKAYAAEDVDLAKDQLALVGRVVWSGKAY